MVQMHGKSQSVETCHLVFGVLVFSWIANERCCVVVFVLKREWKGSNAAMHCGLLQAHCHCLQATSRMSLSAKATPISHDRFQAPVRSRVPTFHVDSSSTQRPVPRSELIGDMPKPIRCGFSTMTNHLAAKHRPSTIDNAHNRKVARHGSNRSPAMGRISQG